MESLLSAVQFLYGNVLTKILQRVEHGETEVHRLTRPSSLQET